jgi:hypothetical protein
MNACLRPWGPKSWRLEKFLGIISAEIVCVRSTLKLINDRRRVHIDNLGCVENIKAMQGVMRRGCTGYLSILGA